MKSLHGLTIGVIGAGKMGQALIKGLRAHQVAGHSIVIADASAKTLRQAKQQFGVRVATNAGVAKQANIVILAVKPQQFPGVVAALAGHLTDRHLVISIAAGIRLDWLSKKLAGVCLVRAMPNLPATVGCGFTALTFGKQVSRRQQKIAWAIFEAVGEVVALPEKAFDAVTAVSGSGPAYVFYLVDAWQRAASQLGFSPSVAVKAIQATLEGSARLLSESKDSAAVLVSKVASKGGTTEAALKVLDKRQARQAFVAALLAAARRSKALSWS